MVEFSSWILSFPIQSQLLSFIRPTYYAIDEKKAAMFDGHGAKIDRPLDAITRL